jgi:hypothetical protein
MKTEWQPIETAPRDRTNVLLFGERGVDYGFWEGGSPAQYECGVMTDPGMEAGWWSEHYYPGSPQQPTHWMPLPSAPEARAAGPSSDKSNADHSKGTP